MKKILLIASLSLLIFSCEKDNDHPNVPFEIQSKETVQVADVADQHRYQDEFTITSTTNVTATVSNVIVSSGTALQTSYVYAIRGNIYKFRVIRTGTNITSYHIEVKNSTETIEQDVPVTY